MTRPETAPALGTAVKKARNERPSRTSTPGRSSSPCRADRADLPQGRDGCRERGVHLGMLEVPEALAALEQISGLLESITIAVADAGSAISAPQKAEADRSEDAVHTQAAFL